jgi:glycosyltransferase involved in cell wall biosynthesis
MTTVSVIMAVYNGAALLPETIASLRAQTLTDWELIAVDDCSSDDSVAVLRGFGDPRIRVIESECNGGPVVARNRAFAEVRGRYVAALDQDDIALPARLQRQAAFLDAHPGTVLVSTAADLLIDDRRVPGIWQRPLSPVVLDWLMQLQNSVVWSSVMFRAEAARRLNPFERPECRYVEDFDLYHRLRGFGRLAQIDAVLTLYRCHDGGASKVHNAMLRANSEALLAELHAPVLGNDDAADFAALLLRHNMAGEPVPDAATLNRMFGYVERVRVGFGTRGYSDAELAEVDAQISRLWWRLCRTGLRAGTLFLNRLTGHGAPPLVSTPDLVASQLIGGMRAMRRGLLRQ